MKKHESSEGLVKVEAGLNGMKKNGKKSSSCSAGLLLAIIIAILLLLSLVISSLFWAVYTKLTSEQLRIFDATSVSDLEPLESNDVFVDNLMLRLAAAHQNETDRVIPEGSGTRKETEVRVEAIPAAGDDSLATGPDSTTETAETSPKFAEKSPDEETSSSEDSRSTTSRNDDAEWSERSETTTKLSEGSLEVFDDTNDNNAAPKTVPWHLEPINVEEQNFKVDSSETSSLNWLPMTSLLNFFNGKTNTEEKHYRLSFSSDGMNIYVETDTEFFPDDENSTVRLDVVLDELESTSSGMSSGNFWDWLASYVSPSSESTVDEETDEDDDEYSYDDQLSSWTDYLEYYEDSESYEDTADESQVGESIRWNDLVGALSRLPIEFSSNLKDELFSDEEDAHSIPNVLHDLRNYTDTLARGVSNVFSTFWNDSPTASENEDIEVAATDSFGTTIPKITVSTEISPPMSSSDVKNENTATDILSRTSEAPVSLNDDGISDPTTDSYDYYWYPDEENFDDDLLPYIDAPLFPEPSFPERSESSSNNGLKHETTLETTEATNSHAKSGLVSFANSDENDDSDSPISGSEDATETAEPSRSYEAEEANENISRVTDPSMANEDLDGSDVNRGAVKKMADSLGFLDDSNDLPYLMTRVRVKIQTIDDNDVQSMKVLDKLLETMSKSRRDLDEVWLDIINDMRDYLKQKYRRNLSRSKESSSSIIPKVFSESTENSDDDSQKPAKIYSIAKRDVIRRRNDLPPRLLRQKTPSEIFARARRVRRVDDDTATSFVGMRRDSLKETRDFDSKMDRVASHIDRLEHRFLRRNKLDDDYISKEMPDDEEDPRKL